MSPQQMSNLIAYLKYAAGNFVPGTKRNFSWWEVIEGNQDSRTGNQSIKTYGVGASTDYISLIWDHSTLFGIAVCGFDLYGFCIKYIAFTSSSSPGRAMGSSGLSSTWNIAKVES